MTKLHLIIPAAGRSSRFYNAGYYTHKPFLTIKYRGKVGYMLDHVLDSMNISPDVGLHIGIPPGYRYYYSRVIQKTKSHVDTVSQLLQSIPDEDAVILADCDVLISKTDFVNMCLALSYNTQPTVLVSDAIQVPGRLTHIDSYPDFYSCNGHKATPYALWSLRGYPNAGKLKHELRIFPDMSSMDDYLFVQDELAFAIKAIETPVDWGTPEALLATGAQIL